MAIILAFVGLYGLNNLGKIDRSLTDMYNSNLLPVADLTSTQAIYQQIRVTIRDHSFVAQTEAENRQYEDQIQTLQGELLAKVDKFRPMATTAREQELMKEFDSAWQMYAQTLQKGIEWNNANDQEHFVELLKGNMKVAGDQVQKALDGMAAFNIDEANRASANGKALYSASHNTTIAIVIAAVLLSIAFGYFIARIIARPLGRTVELVGRVSQGDLRDTLDIRTKDEVGALASSINVMIENLRSTVGGIQASAESVAAASQQISASTEEVASGSATQAAAAQTMTELFKELSAAIGSAAKSAEQASELSNRTMNIAEDGGKVVRSSIEGMEVMNEQIAKLEQDSNQIGEIIEVIDDIAEQTNLLALNAAIEAARAGDQGRGFAVVADEVRKLAERSGEATKQITAIIKGMQENTRQSVKAVSEGVVTSRKTGEAFKQIVERVNESAGKVGEIAAASEEQAAQSSEVLSSIESISAATEEAAASTEQTASTAQSLSQLAEELNRSVSMFRIR